MVFLCRIRDILIQGHSAQSLLRVVLNMEDPEFVSVSCVEAFLVWDRLQLLVGENPELLRGYTQHLRQL